MSYHLGQAVTVLTRGYVTASAAGRPDYVALLLYKEDRSSCRLRTFPVSTYVGIIIVRVDGP
jgi:hypothetical protein